MISKKFKFIVSFSAFAQLVLLVLSSPSALAQSNRAENIFSFRFRAMVWSGIGKDLYYLNGREKVSFTATSSNPSKWLKYRGPAPFYIYKEGEMMLNQLGESVPRPVARFFPKNNQAQLFLLHETDSSAGIQYTIFPITDDADNLQEGFRIVNFTKTEMGIAINEEKALLTSGEVKYLSPQTQEDNSLQVTIATKTNEEWKVRYRNLFRAREGICSTLFVTLLNDSVKTRIFFDRVK